MGRYDRSTTLTDSSGDFVTVGNPLPVTSTGGGSGGGTSQADKSSFGEGTGIGTPIMGVVNDTLGGLVGEDKAAAVRITPARGFHCNLRDVDGNEIGTSGAPLRIDPTGTTPQPVSGTLTIQDGGGSITVDGTVAATQSGSWTVAATQSGSWSVSITGNVTVANLNTADYDTGAGTVTQALVGIALPASGGPVAGGTSTNPVRTDPTGGTAQPVTDGGGSLTVDGSVSISGSVTVTGTVAATQSGSWTVTANAGTGTFAVGQTNAATTDYDTGAGTVTQVMFGMALPASGGPVAGGTTTNPLRTDPTGTTAQPVTDNGGSLTVDGSVSISGSVTVTGTVAATQSGTWNVGLNAGSNTIGKVDQGTAGASAWKVDGSAVTQPVSGTVAATQSGTWTVQQGTPPWSISGSTTAIPTRGSFTDHSGSIASGGTAQSLANSNSSRTFFLVQNNGADDLWINFGSTAVATQPSLQIPVGATYVSDPEFVSTQSVSIISATTGVTFTCKEA